MKVETMESKFIFDKVRKSTAKDNQIAVQGFCTDEYIDGSEVRVAFSDRGENIAVNYTHLFSAIPVAKRIEINDTNITKMMTVLIDLPNSFSDSAALKVESHQLIYKCSGKKIKTILKQLNCCIDSATLTGDKLTVKGWAIDKAPVEFRVLEGVKIDNKSANEDSHSVVTVDRTIRTDITTSHREYKGVDEVGFTLETQVNDKKLYLKTTCGDIEDIQKIYYLDANAGGGALGKIRRIAVKVQMSLKNRGIKGTIEKIKRRIAFQKQAKPVEYHNWAKERLVTEEELAKQRAVKFAYKPLFSIIVPLYETGENYLDELIASVKSQSYGNWQLCFSDGSKDKGRLEKLVGKYAVQDERICYIADAKGPLGISDNTNQALTIAKGDYIVLGDHDDLFTPDALYECVKVLNDNKCDVIYTDEDKIDDKTREYFDPNFKPDFNIDLFTSCNYICHMFVASKKLVDKVGKFNSIYDGAQDYDFIFRCVEQAKDIVHIPKVLYHWRIHKASLAAAPEAKMYAFEAGRKAIEAHYERVGLEAKVESLQEHGFYKTTFAVKGNPKVSIVIPNKDHVADLKKCMDSIEKLSEYRNFEFIVVENNSTEEATFAHYKEIEKKDNVKVVYWDKEFNYSAINNFGVSHAQGEYILLLNNDTEMINPDALSQMVGYCQRDDVGIVGARLYFEDGSIQHAGVIVGYGGVAGHAFGGLFEENNLYMSRTKVACDYSAVTAACLMVKKDIFYQAGQLDEDFVVAFNDVDFCLKVRELGKLVVYNPNAKLYHYESKSRGLEDTPEKLERFNREAEKFVGKWSEIIENGDPNYNVNLALNRSDFAVRK